MSGAQPSSGVPEGMTGADGVVWLWWGELQAYTVCSVLLTLIARFMGPIWDRGDPCWPHELCYLGSFPDNTCTFLDDFSFVTFISSTLCIHYGKFNGYPATSWCNKYVVNASFWRDNDVITSRLMLNHDTNWHSSPGYSGLSTRGVEYYINLFSKIRKQQAPLY